MFETFKFAALDGIGVLTLARPTRLNAVNLTMAHEIDALMRQLRADESLRVLIVTGEGRAFCAGADITVLDTLAGAAAPFRFLETIQLAFNALEALPVPTIAAINGGAFGGGCELALACDFRIMSDAASIGVPEIKLGLLPGAGGTQRLARLLPPAIAKEMIYLGLPLAANRALQHGLVNAVVPAGEVMTEAQAWAMRLRAMPPLALRSAKLLVHGAAFNGLTNGIEAERQAVAYLFQTRDCREGVKAFLDKRSPEFDGS